VTGGRHGLSFLDSTGSTTGPGDIPTPNPGLVVVPPDDVGALLIQPVKHRAAAYRAHGRCPGWLTYR